MFNCGCVISNKLIESNQENVSCPYCGVISLKSDLIALGLSKFEMRTKKEILLLNIKKREKGNLKGLLGKKRRAPVDKVDTEL